MILYIHRFLKKAAKLIVLLLGIDYSLKT